MCATPCPPPSPRVTVLLPTYNAEDFIDETLRSVFWQTFTDFEVLLLDNASTDRTPHVVAGFSDPRLKVVRNPTNIGFAANVQLGRDLATAPYVVVFNADDIWEPSFLARTVAVLDANPNVAVVHCRIVLMDVQGRCYGDAVTDWPALCPGRQAFALSFVAGFSSPAMLMRNSVLRAVGTLPTDEAWIKVPDCWLLLQLCLRGDVAYIGEPLMRYRVHQSSLMSEIYLDGTFFRRQLATVRDAFSWPELAGSGIAGDVAKLSRRVALQAAVTLPTLRATQSRLRVAGAFADIITEVPSILLNPTVWMRFAYSLLPRRTIDALRAVRRRNWALRNQGRAMLPTGGRQA